MYKRQLVSMAFVKDGRLYSHNARIMKPAPEKKLQLKWTKMCIRDSMQTYQSLLKAYDTETEREGWLLTGIDALNYLYRNFSGNFSG